MSQALVWPQAQARRAPRPLLWLVLALHVLVLGLATQLKVWRDRGPVAAPTRPLLLWLLDSKPQNPPPAAEIATKAEQPPALPLPVPSTERIETQAITLPALPDQAPRETVRTPEPTSATDTAPAPLNLALPRAASAPWRQRNPALDDGRANSKLPRNMETLIAQALGGDPNGPISEEYLADGSVRFKRGSQCVISRPNQAQNIDPFNGSVMPKPRLLDRC